MYWDSGNGRYEYERSRNTPRKFKDLDGNETVMFIKNSRLHLGRLMYKCYYSPWDPQYKVRLRDQIIPISESDIVASFGRENVAWGEIDLAACW